MKKLGLGVASCAALIFWTQSTIAEIIVDNTGADPVCQTSEVQMPVGTNADYCIGYLDSVGNPTEETTLLNSRTDGDDWTFAYKNEGSTQVGDLLGGISFELLDVTIGATSGVWTIKWTDTNGSDPYNLPLYVDIAAGMKASTKIAYFLFDDFLLTDDPYQSSGTFDLLLAKDLSHESLFVRIGEGDTPPQETPVPGTLLLLGAPLVGLGAWRRRRS